MPLKSIVKVSHVSNLSDARYCAGMGVDMLGFQVLEGTEHYIAPQVFHDIRGWISGPSIVAELYGITPANDLEAIVQTYAPDYFELTYAEFRKFSHLLTLPCIVYFQNMAEADAIQQDDNVSYIIADEHTSCKDIPQSGIPVLIKTTSAKKLNEHLDEGCFKGIEIEAPKASRPGVTNYDQLGDILEALDED
ncbi:MAG TPA: hypothetical protein VIQ51_14350 [Chryseosolibacter sp.]